MIFQAKTFNVLKADRKTVCGIGVEWTEQRIFSEGFLHFIGCVSLFFGIVIGVALTNTGRSYSPPPPGLHMAAIVCWALFALCWWGKRRFPGKRQSVEFYEDGRIWSSRDGEWGFRAEDIRSIESVQFFTKVKPEDSNYTHGIRLITRRGRVCRIAHRLEPDDSIELAVLMSECVESVRYPQMRATINGEEIAVW